MKILILQIKTFSINNSLYTVYFKIIFLKMKILLALVTCFPFLIFCKEQSNYSCSEIKKFYTISYFKDPSYPIMMDIKFKGFDSFKSVKLDCIENIDTFFLQDIFLESSNKIILNNDLKLGTFSYSPNISKPTDPDPYIDFYLFNLKGLFTSTTSLFSVFTDSFYYERVSVLLFVSSLKTEGNCVYENTSGMFDGLYSLSLAYTTKYSSFTCPFLFRNSYIYQIDMYGLSSTFIKKNIFAFMDTNWNYSIHSKISNIKLGFFKENLNKNILNKLVLERTTSITLKGILDKIENDSFENLNSLIYLELDLDNLRYFLNKGIDWIQSLNNNLNVNLENTTDLENNLGRLIILKFLDESEDFYTFPDEDFCIFKNLPHNKMINPLFSPKVYINRECSCTLVWLFRYTFSFRTDNYPIKGIRFFLSKDFQPCGERKTFKELIVNCSFEKKIRSCNRNYFSVEKLTTFMENVYKADVFDFILIVLIPIICSIGLVANLVNILVLHKLQNKKKYANYSIHKYIYLNSIVNFIYILIVFLHLINKCVTQNGIYCSNLNRYLSSQYFDIYLVNLMGNFLKLFSNLALVCVSLSCLNRGTIWSNLNYISKVFYCIYFFISGLVLIVSKLITNKINLDLTVLNDILEYEEFPIKNFFYLNLGNKRSLNVHSKNALKVHLVIYIADFVLNEFLIYLLMLIVQILLLKRIKSDLKNDTLSLKSQNWKIYFRKTTCFVLVNSFVVILFRFLDMCMSIFIGIERLFSQSIQNKMCLRYSKFCSSLEDANNILFLFSITCFALLFNIISKKNLIKEIIKIKCF